MSSRKDDYFMSMVYLVASPSKDLSTHIGAVIVGPDNEVRSTGYNSFVRGINDDVPERQERPEKYFWFEHAERNAIYNAARVGIPLKGCRMYTNGVPCTNCTRGIIQVGIIEVIVDKFWDASNSEKWSEEAKRSLLMFGEAGVEINYWDRELLKIERFKGGKVFEKSRPREDSKLNLQRVQQLQLPFECKFSI